MKKAMRIMSLVLFVVGMTALTSCSKSNEKLILGKWELEKVSAIYMGQTFEMTIDDLAAMIGVEEVENVCLEFKNNGTVIAADGDIANYTIDKEKLTISSDGVSYEMKIIELTKKDLTVEATEEGTTVTLYFKKA